MAYTARTIKDRIAMGDDCFYIENLPDGRVRLIPAPYYVTEPGTPINKELLQSLEDRVTLLMNLVFADITSNPFNITFGNLGDVVVTGIWDKTNQRIEC